MHFLPGMPGKLLLSFPIYTNAKKILNTNQPAGTLTAVNGIRFVSMTWVILGHTYAFGLNRGGKCCSYAHESNWHNEQTNDFMLVVRVYFDASINSFALT